MNAGLIGGIIGGLVGVLGGLYGTYCAVKNTKGLRERAFMLKASVICWLAIILFLILLFVLPGPYQEILWFVYAILLTVGIVSMNRIQRRIREEESGVHTPKP